MTNHLMDRISGLVFICIGAFVAFGAWQMPRFQDRGAEIYAAPGLTPGLLGVALAFCGLILALRPAGQAADRTDFWDSVAGTPRDRKRAIAALALTLGYGAGLFGNLPYVVATGVFVTGFIVVFEVILRPANAAPRRRWPTIAWALGIGLAVALGTQYLFQTLFLVQLP